VDGKNFVKTILLHETGEMMESLTEIVYNKINDAQAQGSGISYARRYSLQSFVCVGADDDDGQKAVEPKPNATTEILKKAKDGGFSLDQVKTKYNITQQQETIFINL
jgi:hypothetical protein